MLALEIVGVLGAVYAALVWVLIRTQASRNVVRLHEAWAAGKREAG